MSRIIVLGSLAVVVLFLGLSHAPKPSPKVPRPVPAVTVTPKPHRIHHRVTVCPIPQVLAKDGGCIYQGPGECVTGTFNCLPQDQVPTGPNIGTAPTSGPKV